MPRDRSPILLLDDSVVAVDKPSGIAVIQERHDRDAPTLLRLVEAQIGDTFVVHRIDKETSGVVLFARTSEAHRDLSMQFEHGTVRKTYLALLEGAPEGDEGIIDLPIASARGRMKIGAGGKPATTHYRVVRRFRGYSFVEAHPATGRQHQIRVHFAAIGHPLVVDSLYGNRAGFLLSEFKSRYRPAGEIERPLIGRLSLHAAELSFDHPVDRSRVTVAAPLPDDFAATLKQLERWASA
jgi:RluA family pseudouridine synthase